MKSKKHARRKSSKFRGNRIILFRLDKQGIQKLDDEVKRLKALHKGKSYIDLLKIGALNGEINRSYVIQQLVHKLPMRNSQPQKKPQLQASRPIETRFNETISKKPSSFDNLRPKNEIPVSTGTSKVAQLKVKEPLKRDNKYVNLQKTTDKALKLLGLKKKLCPSCNHDVHLQECKVKGCDCMPIDMIRKERSQRPIMEKILSEV